MDFPGTSMWHGLSSELVWSYSDVTQLSRYIVTWHLCTVQAYTFRTGCTQSATGCQSMESKAQETNWLSAKLSPLGFPFGLYMDCNSDYFQCFPFGYIHCSLNRGVQTPYMNYTYNIFHVYTVLNAWNRWQRSVVIQRVYLLSVSPETTPQSGLITVDSEPLHTYCVVTFLLR